MGGAKGRRASLNGSLCCCYGECYCKHDWPLIIQKCIEQKSVHDRSSEDFPSLSNEGVCNIHVHVIRAVILVLESILIIGS